MLPMKICACIFHLTNFYFYSRMERLSQLLTGQWRRSNQKCILVSNLMTSQMFKL